MKKNQPQYDVAWPVTLSQQNAPCDRSFPRGALCWLLLAIAAQPAMAQQKPHQDRTVMIDRVIAVIDDAIVLRSELAARVAPIASNLEPETDPSRRTRQLQKLRSQILEEMINEELIVQYANDSKLEVTSDEIDSALADTKERNKLDDNQLAEALRMQGYTMKGYRDDLRKQILRLRAVNTIVRPRVTIADADVRGRYEEQARRAGAVNEVRLSHILVKLASDADADQVAEAENKAQAIVEQCRAGADFGKLAESLSDDEASRESGGEIGWIQRGSIATEWEEVVFAMKSGDTEGPIRGPTGLHVFHVSDVKQAGSESFEEVKETLKDEMFRAELDRQTRLWIDELRKDAHIDVRL